MKLRDICTDDALMEIREHGTGEFPFQYYYENIRQFDMGYIDWHWHREFELVSIEQGEVHCMIGTLHLILRKGDAIFINTGVIHRFEAPESGIIPNILFSPDFLAPEQSKIYKKYVEIFLNSDITHAVFRSGIPWQNNVLMHLSEIYQVCRAKPEGWELKAHGLTTEIWFHLYTHRDECGTSKKSGISLPTQNRLKKMTGYIETHFTSRITLDDIAKSATISKSEALRCFKTGLQTSPIDYLIKYRLKKAYTLLVNTQKSVSDIAYGVGMENISYFNRRFKAEFHMTPLEVRKSAVGSRKNFNIFPGN